MSTTATVTLHTLEGATASHHATRGWQMTQVAVVEFPSDYTPSSTGGLYQDVEKVLVALVGPRGTPCPDISVPTYLDEFVPELLGHQSARMRIVYKGYPLPTYEVGGSLSQIETNIDRFGNPIKTGYTYPSKYDLDPTKAGKTYKQGAMVSKPVPEPSFTIKFIVVGDGTNSPIFLMTQFSQMQGSVNSSPVTVGTITGGPRTWMVTGSRGVSNDGGNTYEGSFSIQYRKRKWDNTVSFINPDTGLPPDDLDPNSTPPGYYTPEIPDEVAFPIFVFGPN